MSDEKQEKVMRLLLQGNLEMEQAAAFKAAHQHAFRVAFDYMHDCFPPTRAEEYWTRTVQLMVKRVQENRENYLVKTLLLGVYDYLGEIVKDLPVEKEEESENGNHDA